MPLSSRRRPAAPGRRAATLVAATAVALGTAVLAAPAPTPPTSSPRCPA